MEGREREREEGEAYLVLGQTRVVLALLLHRRNLGREREEWLTKQEQEPDTNIDEGELKKERGGGGASGGVIGADREALVVMSGVEERVTGQGEYLAINHSNNR